MTDLSSSFLSSGGWLWLGPGGHLLSLGRFRRRLTFFSAVFSVPREFGDAIFVYPCSRGFTIPEPGRTIRPSIKLGCCAMYMSPELLIVTDTDPSEFGGIVMHFKTLNSGVLAVLSGRSTIMVSAFE